MSEKTKGGSIMVSGGEAGQEEIDMAWATEAEQRHTSTDAGNISQRTTKTHLALRHAT